MPINPQWGRFFKIEISKEIRICSQNIFLRHFCPTKVVVHGQKTQKGSSGLAKVFVLSKNPEQIAEGMFGGMKDMSSMWFSLYLWKDKILWSRVSNPRSPASPPHSRRCETLVNLRAQLKVLSCFPLALSTSVAKMLDNKEKTSRERPKSAPYLRLNKTRKPLFQQLETTKAIKKTEN